MSESLTFPEVRTRFVDSVISEHSVVAPLTNIQAAVAFLSEKLAPECQEVFYAIYMDSKGVPIESREISRGTLSSSLVHPREVFAPALMCRAASIIVAHNHPSGNPTPSADDKKTTTRLVKAGTLLGIQVLDHIVIGHGSHYSFREHNLI